MYIRKGKIIYERGKWNERKTFDSVNAAKRESRLLQSQGKELRVAK